MNNITNKLFIIFMIYSNYVFIDRIIFLFFGEGATPYSFSDVIGRIISYNARDYTMWSSLIIVSVLLLSWNFIVYTWLRVLKPDWVHLIFTMIFFSLEGTLAMFLIGYNLFEAANEA